MAAVLTLNNLGTLAALSLAFLLLYRYRSLPHARRLPRQAYLGAAIVFGGNYLALLGVAPVAIYLTPIAWSGYILWIDGAIYSLRGRSLLRNHPAEFLWLAIASVPLWLIFEAYNLRLANWIYVGLPQQPVLRHFGFAWSFATIWPAIFETAMLLRALDWFSSEPAVAPPDPRPTPAAQAAEKSNLRTSVRIGALLLTVPLIVPTEIGVYLFGAVWLGFIFLLDPVNYRNASASLWRDLRRGESSRIGALMSAGLICGIFWEFWNHLAIGRWFYIVPILQDYKIFAMPFPGYLGFPVFALECFVMFAFVAPRLDKMSHLLGRKGETEWRVFDL